MTRDEIYELVNKGRITLTGLPDSKIVQSMTRDEFLGKYVTTPGTIEKVLNEESKEETPETPEVPEGPEDPKDTKTPEELGTEFASTLKSLGGDVKLDGEAKVEERMQVTKSANVDLGGNTLVSTINGKDALIVSGTSTNVNVKITNGTFIGEGTDDAYGVIAIQKSPSLTLSDIKVEGKNPVMVYSTGAPEIVIESGEFIGTGAQSIYYYKGAGKLTIKGGTFKSVPYNGTYYTLNIKDDQRAENIQDQICVMGGSFYNFNPANCTVEGPETNFVAPGYKVIESKDGEDTVYTVVEDK